MTASELTSLISSVGFPIAAYLLMFFTLNKSVQGSIDNMNKMMDSMADIKHGLLQMSNDITRLSSAIERNNQNNINNSKDR